MGKEFSNSRVINRCIAFIVIHLLFFSHYGLASENELEQQPPGTQQEPKPPVPDLADIVPLEVKLIANLKLLERELEAGLDHERLERGYAELEVSLADLSSRLDLLKESREYKYTKLVDLRELVKQKSGIFESVNQPVSDSVRRLGMLRERWQEEGEHWRSWQGDMLKKGQPETLKLTFDRATMTIDSALDLILSQLDAILLVQERAGRIERQFDTISAEIDEQISEERLKTNFSDTPLMFSGQYLQQLGDTSLWDAAFRGMQDASSPDREMFRQHGWIVVLQGFITIVFVAAFKRKKQLFEQVEGWRFLTVHPFAAGLFLGYIMSALIYEYQGAPSALKFLAAVVGGLSFASLMRGVVDESWKHRFIQGLILAVLLTWLVQFLSVPIPLVRLYICMTTLAGFFFCWYLLAYLRSRGDTGLYPWLLRVGMWLLLAVFIIEVWGKKASAAYLFSSSLHSIAVILVFALFMCLIRGGFAWLFSTALLRRSTALSDSVTDMIVDRLTRFCDALIIGLVIVPAVLMIWNVFPSLGEATQGVLGFGYKVGETRITIGLLFISAAVLYGSFLISWVVQNLLIDELLFNKRMEKAARISIAKLAHYVIVFIGFLLAISALGIDITKLTIMVSALGVGIGFGLKDIVNNFMSGLILLFEQPIRVGDIVEIDGIWAEIKHIGIRSTMVRNMDHADMIIPNADLISNRVTNWTLEDRQARLIIVVGVAYGSDVDLVTETLLGCAKDNKHVSGSPSPQALFLNFGDSTLDFELRMFVPASMRIPIRSELHHAIDKRFRDNNIVIAFPQRDLHVTGLAIQGNDDGKGDRQFSASGG